MADFLNTGDNRPLTFAQLPFGQPLFILYSSGTSGKPKCILHCAGVRICTVLEGLYSVSAQGVLLNTKKELRIGFDSSEVDTYFQYTTVSCLFRLEMYSQVLLKVDWLDDVDLYACRPLMWIPRHII